MEHSMIILVVIFLNDVDNILMERNKILSKPSIDLYFLLWSLGIYCEYSPSECHHLKTSKFID